MRIAFLLAATLFAAWTPAADAETLKIATIAPEGSTWMTNMREGANEIEVLTKGRVKFKFYGGGVQGNEKQVQRKMRIGQLHGGAFTASGLATFQKDANLYALPMLFENMEEVDHVRERMDARLRGRLEEAGFVSFGFAGGGFAYLMSNKPIRTLDDMSGQKTWVPEGDEIAFAALRALGIAPVSMPMTDVLTGLQTDLLDSVTVSPVGAVVLQWHTRLRWIMNEPLVYTYGGLIIDRRVFDKLGEEDQAVVRKVMDRVYAEFDRLSIEDDAGATKALLDSGLEFVDPNAGEVDEWRRIVAKSNRESAERGAVDVALLDEALRLIDTLRDPGAGAP